MSGFAERGSRRTAFVGDVSPRAPGSGPATTLRTLGFSAIEAKGLILSHLIGFSVFWYLVVDRMKGLTYEIPHTKVIEIPIRLVAIWLFLDHFGRRGRVRFGLWDLTYIVFVGLYGVGVVYADLFMWRQTGFLNYIGWVETMLSPFLFFLVVREGTLRKGFNPGVVLWWTLGTLAFCALLGLGQALGVLGIRQFSAELYRWEYYDLNIQGPSAPYQARGTLAHANAQAIYMMLGFCAAPALMHFPRYRKWVIPLMLTFLVGGFATYSRMGMVAMFAGLFGVGIFLLVRRNINAGFAVLGTLVFLGVAFLGIIYAYDVKRFKGPIEGHGVVKGATGNLDSFEIRMRSSRRALQIGAQFPIFGVNAVGGAINELRVISSNPYSFDAILNSLGPFTFASYGIVGLLFLAGFYFALLRTPWLETRLVFLDVALFMTGWALLVAGITENVVFLPQPMTIVNVLVGLMYGYGWTRLARSQALDALAVRKWQPMTSLKSLLPR